MGVANRLADKWIERQVETLRVAGELGNYSVIQLEALEKRVLARLARTDLTVFQSSRLTRALREIRGIITEVTTALGKKLEKDFAEIADIATTTAARDINSAVRADIATGNGVNIRALKASEFINITHTTREDVIGSPIMGGYFQKLPQEYFNHYRRVLSEGVAIGRTMREILADVESYPGFTGTRANLRTFVRSSVIEVHNHARRAFYKDNADLMSGIQWLSTLDSRTSNICKALDGLTWDGDYKPVGHGVRFPGSIAHPNCRSTQLPILKSLEEIVGNKKLAAKVAKMPASTRASMDGQVADDIVYGDWLKKKGDAFAREVLGPGRFDLWKAGQLSVRDLVNQDARPLTLEQLRARIAAPRPVEAPPPAPPSKAAQIDFAEAGAQYAERILEAFDDETGTELALALDEYTVNSLPFNFPLYGGQQINTVEALREARQHALAMARAMGQVPTNANDLLLYRGNGGLDPKWAVGDVVEHRAFMSTSWDISVVSDFMEGSAGPDKVLFRIRAKPGTLRGLPGSTEIYEQSELVLPPGQRFRVLAFENRSGTLVYDIEPIADSVDFAALPTRVSRAFDEAIASIAPPPRAARGWPASWDQETPLEIPREEWEAIAAWRTEIDVDVTRAPDFLSGKQVRALYDYRAGSYREINRVYRDFSDWSYKGEAQDLAQRLEDLFARTAPALDGPVRLWRGVVYNKDHPWPNFAAGDVFDSRGWLSTSADREMAAKFAWRRDGKLGLTASNPVDMFEVRAAAGARVLPGTEGETELIFHPQSRYRVIRTYVAQIRNPYGYGDPQNIWVRFTVVEHLPRG